MMINVLGRPIVVGDIIELPGEVQYDAKLQPIVTGKQIGRAHV